MKLFFPKEQSRLLLYILLLTAISFSNTIWCGFVYDDLFQIIEPAQILGDWSSNNLARVTDRDLWAFFSKEQARIIKTPYYRPVFALVLMLNYWYGGLNPAFWHLTSLLLHLVAVVFGYFTILATLVSIQNRESTKFSLFDANSNTKLIVLASTIFFAIHPAQSESVAFVAAYVNALSAIFMFAAILTYLKARTEEKRVWLLLSLLMQLLALLTKEVAVVVPIIILSYELILFQNIFQRKKIYPLLPAFITTVAYTIFRIKFFGTIKPPQASSLDFPEIGSLSFSMLLFTLPKVLLKYLEIVVWPTNLGIVYPVHHVLKPDLQNFYLPLFFIIFISVIALLAGLFNRKVRLALIWIVIPLLPILEVRAFHYEKVVQDRYLYLSMLGFGLLFGVLIDELYKTATRVLVAHPEKRKSLDRITTTIVMGIVMIMGASTVKQNMSWATEWDLWMNANLSSPGSCTANMELGALCEKEEKYQEALYYFQQAYQSCPNSLKLQHKLGYIYGRFNDLSKAEEAFQKILVLAKNRSTIATAYKNLGIIYEKRGNLSKALYYYQKGLELDPFSQTASEVKKIVAELNKKIAQGDKNEN